MIIIEKLIIGGREFTKTYSNEGYMIERDGQRYEEAFDPIEFERIYVETDEKIQIFTEETIEPEEDTE